MKKLSKKDALRIRQRIEDMRARGAAPEDIYQAVDKELGRHGLGLRKIAKGDAGPETQLALKEIIVESEGGAWEGKKEDYTLGQMLSGTDIYRSRRLERDAVKPAEKGFNLKDRVQKTRNWIRYMKNVADQIQEGPSREALIEACELFEEAQQTHEVLTKLLSEQATPSLIKEAQEAQATLEQYGDRATAIMQARKTEALSIEEQNTIRSAMNLLITEMRADKRLKRAEELRKSHEKKRKVVK